MHIICIFAYYIRLKRKEGNAFFCLIPLLISKLSIFMFYITTAILVSSNIICIILNNLFEICISFKCRNIMCTTLLSPFFFRHWRLYCKKNCLYIYDSKYCLFLTIIFSHFSGSVRKNCSSFEAIHVSIQFLTSL